MQNEMAQGTVVELVEDVDTTHVIGRTLVKGTRGRIAGPVVDDHVTVVSARWMQGERWRISFATRLLAEVK